MMKMSQIYLDKNFLQKLNLFLLIICLLFLFYILVVEIHSPCGECTAKPFIFGAKLIEEQYGESVIGKIQFQTNNPSSIIYFNSNTSWIQHPQDNLYPLNLDSINFSNHS